MRSPAKRRKNKLTACATYLPQKRLCFARTWQLLYIASLLASPGDDTFQLNPQRLHALLVLWRPFPRSHTLADGHLAQTAEVILRRILQQRWGNKRQCVVHKVAVVFGHSRTMHRCESHVKDRHGDANEVGYIRPSIDLLRKVRIVLVD